MVLVALYSLRSNLYLRTISSGVPSAGKMIKIFTVLLFRAGRYVKKKNLDMFFAISRYSIYISISGMSFKMCATILNIRARPIWNLGTNTDYRYLGINFGNNQLFLCKIVFLSSFINRKCSCFFFFFTNCIIFRNNNYYHSRILMCRQPTTLIFFNGINLFSRNGVCFPKKDRRELHMFHLSGPVQDTGHLTMWTQLLQSLHFYSLGQTGRVQLSSLSQRLQDKT